MAEAGNQALGFIMTVYRRRLTSSFEAIKRSLRRRLSVLEDGKNLAELLTDDDNVDVEGSLFEPEVFDTRPTGSAMRSPNSSRSSKTWTASLAKTARPANSLPT